MVTIPARQHAHMATLCTRASESGRSRHTAATHAHDTRARPLPCWRPARPPSGRQFQPGASSARHVCRPSSVPCMLAAPGMRRPRWAFMPVFRFPPASSGGCAQVSTLPTIYLRRLLWRFFLDTLSWFCIACRIACAIVFVVLGYCASEKAPFLSENALSLLRTPAHFIQHFCAFCMPPLLWECCIRWM